MLAQPFANFRESHGWETIGLEEHMGYRGG